MSEAYTAAQRAEGRIGLAIQRLMEGYPFHATILEQWTVMAKPDIGTMGVTVSGGNILLLHNPRFVLDIPIDELGGVLLHEVHHVILGHVLARPEQFPDQWARTMAEEVTVNEFIREPLPRGAITLSQFPELSPMESTAQRYKRLIKVKPQHRLGTAENDRAGKEGKRGNDVLNRATRTNTAPNLGRNGGQLGGGDRPLDEKLETLDNHTVWAEARQNPEQSRAVIRDLVQDAALEVGHAQIPPELHPALGNLGVGQEAGQCRQDLEEGKKGRTNWLWLLRQHIGQVLKPRPVFNRPPRRFPNLAGLFPGQRRQAVKPIIMAVVDTSNSMSRPLLEQINGELTRLARSFCVKVVECDAQIHRVYEYRPLKHVYGRGGTDLRPPLKRNFLQRHHPDLVLYFTDGLGPAPARPPGPPVIWCLTPDGTRPAPWGWSVRMDGRPITSN